MIDVKNLRKTYGSVVAVDDISFEAKKGDILGFIGPNGAGKTTTLRILSCFIEPDSGAASVAGFDIRRRPVEVRRALGYVSEKCPFYGEMTPRWFLKFVCDVRGINGARFKAEIDRVAAIGSLQGVMDRRIETLSKGFQRRLGLAQSLLGDPPVLILDEPLSSEQYAIGFLKGNTELRDAVNAELLKMAEDGTMLEIAQKYVDQGLVLDSLCLINK